MKTKLPRWYATDIGSEFVLSNGQRTEYVRSEHCKACALVKVISKYGGDADLRGLSAYGMCYQMLAITVRASRDPEQVDVDNPNNEGNESEGA